MQQGASYLHIAGSKSHQVCDLRYQFLTERVAPGQNAVVTGLSQIRLANGGKLVVLLCPTPWPSRPIFYHSYYPEARQSMAGPVLSNFG